MIEDHHANKVDDGSITFYLRTQSYSEDEGWRELLEGIKSVELEITGVEPLSDDIQYLPLRLLLDGEQVRELLQSFHTTFIDVTLLRLPSCKVFNISPSKTADS